MKKALVLLLTLAVVGGVFAQDLKLSGGVYGGFEIKKMGDLDAIVVGEDYNTHNSDDAMFFQLNGDYDAKEWGVSFGLEANPWTKEANAVGNLQNYIFMYNAHAWVKMLDGMLTFKGGLVDPDPWSAGGVYLDDPGVNGGGLFQLEAKPIDGLSLGFAFHWPTDVPNATWNDGSDDVDIPNSGKGKYPAASSVANFFKETSFGFRFKNDMLNISAGLKLYGEDSKGDTDMKVVAGAGYTGIDGMAFHLSMMLENLLIDAPKTKTQLGLDANFTKLVDGLFVQLATLLIMQDGASTEMEIRIRPRASYQVLDNFTVTARVPVILKDNGDGLGLATVGLDLWLRYHVGKAYLMPVYQLRVNTADYGDSVNHQIGVFYGASF